MPYLRFPIHEAPGAAWTLVMQFPAAVWAVEEVRTQPNSQTLTPLDEFRHSEAGIKLAHWLGIAMATAKAD